MKSSWPLTLVHTHLCLRSCDRSATTVQRSRSLWNKAGSQPEGTGGNRCVCRLGAIILHTGSTFPASAGVDVSGGG